MNASPKPAPPKTRPIMIAEEIKPSNPAVKKPFVPTEHLTARPFRENEELRALQEEMRKNNPEPKRSVRTPRTAANKKQEKK